MNWGFFLRLVFLLVECSRCKRAPWLPGHRGRSCAGVPWWGRGSLQCWSFRGMGWAPHSSTDPPLWAAPGGRGTHKAPVVGLAETPEERPKSRAPGQGSGCHPGGWDTASVPCPAPLRLWVLPAGCCLHGGCIGVPRPYRAACSQPQQLPLLEQSHSSPVTLALPGQRRGHVPSLRGTGRGTQ